MGRWPKMTSPAAGSWGVPGTGIGRPRSVAPENFTTQVIQQIRPGEGSKSAVVPASGTVTVSLGPEGLAQWAITYVAISSAKGVSDPSVAYCAIGPAGGGGIGPAGTGYAGGGDTISLGGALLMCGEYVFVTWSGATPGEQVIARVYGNQQVLALWGRGHGRD